MVNLDRRLIIKDGAYKSGDVLYWMSRDMRAEDNHALSYARDEAERQNKHLIVCFCLTESFLGASNEQYLFMLENLQEVQARLWALNIPMLIFKEEASIAIPSFSKVHGLCLLVTDFDPLRPKRDWLFQLKGELEIPIHQIDAHNIVPVWRASDKKEFAARTIRPKIHAKLSEYLQPMPTIKGQVKPPEIKPFLQWDELFTSYAYGTDHHRETKLVSGKERALSILDGFLEHDLSAYDQRANDANQPAQSGLSAYLHFGQISAQRVALAVLDWPIDPLKKEGFLEQLIVRSELADNFCYYEENYDKVEGFADWAKKTIEIHNNDQRDYLYEYEAFDEALTHDELWNAGQRQMKRTGIMHGYVRMYWAKKILEWTPSVEVAMQIAIALNDRYSFDGRDANGYAGIAWSIGGIHDHGWKERPVYGKIRYMTQAACKRQFDIKKYIETHKKR